jgi:hypothetical protein
MITESASDVGDGHAQFFLSCVFPCHPFIVTDHRRVSSRCSLLDAAAPASKMPQALIEERENLARIKRTDSVSSDCYLSY